MKYSQRRRNNLISVIQSKLERIQSTCYNSPEIQIPPLRWAPFSFRCQRVPPIITKCEDSSTWLHRETIKCGSNPLAHPHKVLESQFNFLSLTTSRNFDEPKTKFGWIYCWNCIIIFEFHSSSVALRHHSDGMASSVDITFRKRSLIMTKTKNL